MVGSRFRLWTGIPETGAAVEGFVRLGEQGVVRSWTWVSSPAADSPIEAPFALALVQIDGAETALLHVVDAGDEAKMSTGMVVRADWRAERTGSILDIRAFVPGPAEGTPPADSSARRIRALPRRWKWSRTSRSRTPTSPG